MMDGVGTGGAVRLVAVAHDAGPAQEGVGPAHWYQRRRPKTPTWYRWWKIQLDLGTPVREVVFEHIRRSGGAARVKGYDIPPELMEVGPNKAHIEATVDAFKRVEAGLRLAHHRPDARLFCAGAWAHHFSMSHPGALKSGMTAALFARGRARPGLLLPEPLVQGPTARKKARLREARRLARRTARRARGLDAQHAREPPTPS